MPKRSWAELPHCLPLLALRVFWGGGGSRLDLLRMLPCFSPTFHTVSPSQQLSALGLARVGALD